MPPLPYGDPAARCLGSRPPQRRCTHPHRSGLALLQANLTPAHLAHQALLQQQAGLAVQAPSLRSSLKRSPTPFSLCQVPFRLSLWHYSQPLRRFFPARALPIKQAGLLLAVMRVEAPAGRAILVSQSC